MNGWTALHWAAKRNHEIIVRELVMSGADPNISNDKGDIPADLTINGSIKRLLGKYDDVTEGQKTDEDEAAFVPNYLRHPDFFYSAKQTSAPSVKETESDKTPVMATESTKPLVTSQALTIKARTANEEDYIEVDVPQLSYESFISACCSELDIDRSHVSKVKKLPDILVRNDRDVQRLSQGQEIVIFTK
eukprot:Colp12_sorted_trinity150504_noHs@31080